MSEIDWARYTGLTVRSVAKRSMEEIIAEKEAGALRMMFGRIRAPQQEPVVAPPDVALSPPTFNGIPFPAPGELTRPEVQRTCQAIEPQKFHVPELVAGMRVRLLDPRSENFGAEGSVFFDAQFGYCVRWPASICPLVLSDWCSAIFPDDPSLLPPREGMEVCMRYDAHTLYSGRLAKRGIQWFIEAPSGTDGGRFVCFDALHSWLRTVWPTWLGAA